MAFFKFRRGGPGNEGRGAAAAAPAGRGAIAAAPAESVEAMRRRARHRLLGAAVLLLIGVIGFPLLFDTQPRPISVDIPIEIPDRNKVKPLALPTPPATTTSNATPDAKGNAGNSGKPAAAGAAANSGQADDGIITETADGTEIRPGKQAAALAAADAKADASSDAKLAAVKPDTKTDAKADSKPKPDAKADTKSTVAKADAKPAASAKSADDGDRARALLEGKPVTVAVAASAAAASSSAAAPAASDNGRFVVQVGAFADADKAKDVRQKLEKAGLKTFTNVAKTADGERTRVRVGPFATRADADKAASKVKGLSLPASVLSL